MTANNLSQSGVPRNKDMEMSGTGDDNDKDFGDRKGEEKRDKKEQGEGNDNQDKNTPSNNQIIINDPKDMICKEFTILHHPLTYIDVESVKQVREMMLEMQRKDPLIVFHPSNKHSQP